MTLLATIWMIASTFIQGHEVESMKLVETKHGIVLVEFREDVVIINDPMIEAELKEKGIFIPPAMRAEFDGKKFVKIGDADFQKAFEEVYYTFTVKDKTRYVIKR